MTEIILPFPPSDLSPNARKHWAVLSKTKRIYRLECFLQTKKLNAQVAAAGQLRLELKFFKPNRRDMDRDNLLARMKSGLDGVADALGINDKRFEPIVVSVADEIGGFVRVRIFDEGE